MTRTVSAEVNCDVCGNCGDCGVVLAAGSGTACAYLIQLCNPCLYEAWEQAKRRKRLEELPEDSTPPAGVRANYYGPNWQAVRAVILSRDGNRCQGSHHAKWFNMGEHRLVVHHIKPLREFGGDYSAANVPENLITLCTTCHGMAHADLNEAKAAAQAQGQQ